LLKINKADSKKEDYKEEVKRLKQKGIPKKKMILLNVKVKIKQEVIRRSYSTYQYRKCNPLVFVEVY
jgi:hypothetical protein